MSPDDAATEEVGVEKSRLRCATMGGMDEKDPKPAGGWRHFAHVEVPPDTVITDGGWVVPRPATREDVRQSVDELRTEFARKPSPPSPLDAIADALAERVGQRLAPPPAPVVGSEDDDARSVSIEEAAQILGVSQRTVARGIADRSIPSMKIRGRRVVHLGKLLRQNSDEEIARRAREILRAR
jgi:excisionase family DNA binding protein